jgi:hypothetical protein
MHKRRFQSNHGYSCLSKWTCIQSIVFPLTIGSRYWINAVSWCLVRSSLTKESLSMMQCISQLLVDLLFSSHRLLIQEEATHHGCLSLFQLCVGRNYPLMSNTPLLIWLTSSTKMQKRQRLSGCVRMWSTSWHDLSSWMMSASCEVVTLRPRRTPWFFACKKRRWGMMITTLSAPLELATTRMVVPHHPPNDKERLIHLCHCSHQSWSESAVQTRRTQRCNESYSTILPTELHSLNGHHPPILHHHCTWMQPCWKNKQLYWTHI